MNSGIALTRTCLLTISSTAQSIFLQVPKLLPHLVGSFGLLEAAQCPNTLINKTFLTFHLQFFFLWLNSCLALWTYRALTSRLDCFCSVYLEWNKLPWKELQLIKEAADCLL